MIRFVVVPRGKHYWIQMTTRDGQSRLIERYDSAEAAIERRRVLEQSADDIEFGKLIAKGI
jgi:hypothetical protein